MIFSSKFLLNHYFLKTYLEFKRVEIQPGYPSMKNTFMCTNSLNDVSEVRLKSVIICVLEHNKSLKVLSLFYEIENQNT